MRIFNPIPTHSQINWLTKDTKNLLCLTLPPKCQLFCQMETASGEKDFSATMETQQKGRVALETEKVREVC